jgi:thiosulfate/3-mercaptopyruvate sulfurtransferase
VDTGDPLVSPEWLADLASGDHSQDLVVVDLRWREDGSGPARFRTGHVPGAVFCNWTTDLVDPDHRFAFMLAPPERFAAAMSRLGIGDGTTVVAYADDLGSGPFRLWWACRVYGHDQVRLLDGGFERWLAEDRPVESGDTPVRSTGGVTSWTPRPPVGGAVATAEDVADAERDHGVVVLDSRPAFQFRGEAVWFETGAVAADADGVAHTPRGPLRAGHVPWARNIPSASLYAPDGRLKQPADLRALFADAGVTAGARAVTYCGVGISASALLFALRRAGIDDVRLYDASWEEWGRDPERPVAR